MNTVSVVCPLSVTTMEKDQLLDCDEEKSRIEYDSLPEPIDGSFAGHVAMWFSWLWS